MLIDGAQAVPHLPVDVQALDCDFYAFSGHKLYGPTGVGVLYGKAALLEAMPPYQGGGEMISAVTFEKTFYKDLPSKFEAGTPNITGVIGLGAAIDYLERASASTPSPRTSTSCSPTPPSGCAQIPQVRIIGTARDKAGVASFVIDGIHPHDIGTILDREGIAVRTGHHCAQPVMQRFDVPATTRASFAFYNTTGRGRRAGRRHPQGHGGVRVNDDLRELYQDVIIDHSKRPRNFRALERRGAQGGRLQSAVRRHGDRLPDAGRATW